MSADSPQSRWTNLLLATALLTVGCASLPPQGQAMNLRYVPRGAVAPGVAKGSREAVTALGPGRVESASGGAVPQVVREPGRQSVTQVRQAVLDAAGEVLSSTSHMGDALSKLAASQDGIGGRANGLFMPYVLYGEQQLQWINAARGGVTRLANVASEVDDPDMELALLQLTGPRLQATLLGSMLLAAWIDFLNLADVVLQYHPSYSVERLVRNTDRLQKMMEPSMTAFSSLEPWQVEAMASELPGLMGQLTHEFNSTRESMHGVSERVGQLMLAAQLMEMLTMMSAMKMSLPRPPPTAPVTLGVGLAMGADGVMMGTRIVVSAEWMERMRQLIQAGVISVPVVSAAVRISAGQVMMSQARDELPQGVRDALGDGPEVRGMHETGRAGAGMAEPPRHHVLPQEHRQWFEKRGFTDEMSIDQFCVRMEQAHHEAIHGGGNWRLGRMWPNEWNQMIMEVLQGAETKAGRMLTQSEILETVAFHMKRYLIPVNFTQWRGK